MKKEEEFKTASIREFFESPRQPFTEVDLTPYEILQVVRYNKEKLDNKVEDNIDPYDMLDIKARKDLSKPVEDSLGNKVENLIKEVKQLGEQFWALQPTGICDACVHYTLEENKQLKKKLDCERKVSDTMAQMYREKKAVVEEIAKILNECVLCGIEPPAMKHYYPECCEKIISNIKEILVKDLEKEIKDALQS